SQRRDLTTMLAHTFDPVAHFLDKSFIAQHRLPSHRFERIFDLAQQPFFNKAPVLQALLSNWTTQAVQDGPFLDKGELLAQPRIPPVRAPFECSQSFSPFTRRPPAQGYTAHRVKMHIAT